MDDSNQAIPPIVFNETTITQPAAVGSGWRTTEFWLSLLVIVLSSLATSGLIAPDSQAAKLAGVVGIVLTSLGYTAGRVVVKRSAGSIAPLSKFVPIIAVTGLIFVSGCSGVETAWVQADRARLDVIEPEHRSYVLADPLLHQDQKDRRILLLDAWKLSVEIHEAGTRK